jgi:hypothetical protein
LDEYTIRNGLNARPFLKDVIDDLIEDIQGARLRRGVLPLDRFAQSEIVGGRIEVTINSRIPEMPTVKDIAGVELVSKCHESLHIARDFRQASLDEGAMLMTSSPTRVQTRQIVCRHSWVRCAPVPLYEFVAENAALATAIAGPDLIRSRGFIRFQRLAGNRGDLGRRGWEALYDVCAEIGVNVSALVRYFGYLGLCQVIEDGSHRRLYVTPGPFRELAWWKPDSELIEL